MDIPLPTDTIAQTLIGLREVSAFKSEGQDCNLEKGDGEIERIHISSGDAKGEVESATLEGEEKGESVLEVSSQDEILM